MKEELEMCVCKILRLPLQNAKVEKGYNSHKIYPIFFKSKSGDLLFSLNKFIKLQGPN